MAFSITDGEIAVVLRLTTDPDKIPPTSAIILKYLIPAAKDLITRYAPDAPEDVCNAALTMLVGVMYDQDPANPITNNPLVVSGAQTLLARWRTHRAEQVNPDIVTVKTSGFTIPPPPDDNNLYLLSVDNTVFTWLKFPVP